MTVTELAKSLRSGERTAVALAEDYFDLIERHDHNLNAFITVSRERALSEAELADRRFQAGEDLGPLHGIPYALKDIYATADVPTTCNSRLYQGFVPKEDAESVRLLKQAGAVLLGKLNTHEFALGGPGFDLPMPPARNPWNVEHFTGGSSSGAGAALAAGLTPIAMGSDTGGSMRSPASLCGVVAIKPTYGLVSRRGVFPLSYTLDHCGPMARTVEDAAIALNAVAKFDRLDPSSVDAEPMDYRRDLSRGVFGLHIAYARKLGSEAPGVTPEVVALNDRCVERLARLGAAIDEVDLPDFDAFKACGRIIMCAEAFAIHEGDLQSRPEAFGRYMYQRVAPAAALSAADYIQAMRLRLELTQRFNREIFGPYDALFATVSVTPAAPLSVFPKDWPPPSWAVAVQTVPFNVTGNPALALPIGFSRSGLPIGAQIVGRFFDEITVFRVAAALETDLSLGTLRPQLPTAAAIKEIQPSAC